jgi:hypothetical protein
MTKDEALKRVLEALEEHHYGVAQIIIREALAQPEQDPDYKLLFDALVEKFAMLQDEVAMWKKQALFHFSVIPPAQPEQKPEQKPVAWMDADGNVSDNNDHNCFPIPLYTFPPQRKWVGLTVEEVAYFSYVLDHWTTTHIRGIEAKLKEKNT